MDFSGNFGCAPQFIFWKLMQNLLLVVGPPFRDRKSLETKQTQVKPNANRGWPIKPVNHIRPQLTRLCPNSSWTPTSQNANGAPPCWGFQRFAGIRIGICDVWSDMPASSLWEGTLYGITVQGVSFCAIVYPCGDLGHGQTNYFLHLWQNCFNNSLSVHLAWRRVALLAMFSRDCIFVIHNYLMF